MVEYEYLSYGDSTLCVDFSRNNKFSKNGWKLAHGLASKLNQQEDHHFKSIIPTFNTVLIHFDSTEIPFQQVRNYISEVIETVKHDDFKSKELKIPVVYGGEFGPDLPQVAKQINCKEEELVDRHMGSESIVICFTSPAGQPLLSGSQVPDRVQRVDEPRTRVPMGSVGVVGNQTAIYSMESPGGWQLIGRTPVKITDVTQYPPTILRVGDKVSFYRIHENEWDKYSSMSLSQLFDSESEG